MFLARTLPAGGRRLEWPLSILLGVCFASVVTGQPGKPSEKASLQIALDRSGYEPGTVARVAANMTIERGWHTNSHEPTYDYLIATEAEFLLPDGWEELEIEYPPGELKSFAFADQPISVYEGRIAIIGSIRIPDDHPRGSWPIDVSLTYQACDDRSCLPPVTTTSTALVEIGDGGQPSKDPTFSQAAAPADRSRSAGLPLMLLLGLAGGLILNAMPCVLPVLSLKVFGLVKSAGRGRTEVVVGSISTALGILVSFWALALAAVVGRAAGAAVGWGVQFQEPTFVAVLAIIVVLFCLNLWGIFEIPLPRRLARLADSGPKEGVPGHLAAGLFATLMATPCSAPFLGSAVGFALSQTPSTIFSIFTAIAIGMALPYLVLAAAPGTARFLPKPGPWMDQLRVAMGFLLAGAAVWLFYVLAAQMSRERLAFIELSILGLALFIWIRHRASSRSAVKILGLVGTVICAALGIALAAGATHPSTTDSKVESAGRLIDWNDFDRLEAESLAAEGRLVFVDVTADWCFTCKVNERLVLETPEVAAAFERYGVIAMKADWTNRSDAITRFLADHGRYGIPFYLLYRPDDEPYLFPELLTREGILRVIEAAAASPAIARPTTR